MFAALHFIVYRIYFPGPAEQAERLSRAAEGSTDGRLSLPLGTHGLSTSYFLESFRPAGSPPRCPQVFAKTLALAHPGISGCQSQSR